MISDLDLSARLLVAALLGCLIGFERERLLWAAGIRTHMLVSVGAALLMIVSAYSFQHATTLPHVVLDPSRVAAQVVSGIGFLGAGSILLRGHVVRGLTTAASIWATAAVGLATGGGLFFAATISTAIILAILAGVKPLEDAYRRRIKACVLQITAEPGVITPEALKTLVGVRMSQVVRVVIQDAGEVQTATVNLARVSDSDIRTGATRLRRAEGVLDVEVQRRRHARKAED